MKTTNALLLKMLLNEKTILYSFFRTQTSIMLVISFLLLAPSCPVTAKTPSIIPLLPAQAKASISATVGKHESRYHIQSRNGHLEAQNTNHGLNIAFLNDGVHIKKAKNHLIFQYLGLSGGKNNSTKKDVSKPVILANRAEYHHSELTEWYVNGPFGLEQGFTLINPPTKNHNEPVNVMLKIAGDLHAVTETGNEDIALKTADGKSALGYRGLTAWDATGKHLPAWWHVTDNIVTLNVDDHGAKYPVTIDPFIEQAKLKANDGVATDNPAFGRAIAISGNTVVVGAEGDDPDYVGDAFGSAYVFEKPVNGWNGELMQSAKLNSPTGTLEGHQLGHSLSIDCDTIVVGGFGNPVGSAYVYVKPLGGWAGELNPTAKLRVASGATNEIFGSSVAISGSTVVIGARAADIGGNLDQGAAYIFEKPTGGWSGIVNEIAKLVATNGVANAFFGSAVAISGNTVVVGANGAPDPTVRKGMAYVYEKPVAGWSEVLTENAQLRRAQNPLTSTIDNSSAFGSSIDIDGDVIVVGAERIASATLDEGRGHVYIKPASGWAGILTQSAVLDATDGLAIGHSVSLAGDTIVMGGAKSQVNGQNNRGAAYIFRKPSTGWSGTLTHSEKLIATDGAAFDAFGSAVAIDDEKVVVGAESDDFGTVSQGSAYVFGLPDVTAPVTSIFSSPTVNSNGWINTTAHFRVIAEDEESGSGLSEIRCVLNPSSPPTVFGELPSSCAYLGSGGDINAEGLNTLFAASKDNAGNAETPPVIGTVRIDTIKPTVTAGRNPTANNNGWNNTDVTIDFNCSDNLVGSGLESCSPPQTLTSEGGNQSASGSGVDLAGNTTTTIVTNINIDKTSPVITGSLNPQPNTNGWNKTIVTVNFTCADNVGGSGMANCGQNQSFSDEGINFSASGTASDLAGNTASTLINGIHIDKTPPLVTMTGVIDGANYTLGSVPNAQCETTDQLSGVQNAAVLSITGGNPDGTGNFTASCTDAEDRAGNAASLSINYQVVGGTFNFSGFLQPVDNTPIFNQVKSGSGVAVKFSLGGDFGLAIFAVGSPTSQAIGCDASMPLDDIEQTIVVNGNSLTYDSATGLYSFNWKTQKAWSGTCRKLILALRDGSQHLAYFKLK